MSDFYNTIVENNGMVKYVVGASQIKYTILDELMENAGIKVKRDVCLHIDANAIFYRFYRNKNLTELSRMDFDIAVRDCVVSVMNVIAHYRKYIATHLHADNSILVYYNTNPPTYQRMFYKDYMKKHYDNMSINNKDYGHITEYVLASIRYIKSLIAYVTNAYWIDTGSIDVYAAIAANIMYGKEDRTNIILSKNVLLSQLINTDCFQIYPNRDKSYLITYDTLYSNGILNGYKSIKAENKMSAAMLPFIWALGGCKDIELKPSSYTTGIVSAIKLFNTLLSDGKLSGTVSLSKIIEEIISLAESSKVKYIHTDKDGTEDLMNRYRITCLPLAVSAISRDQLITLEKSKINIFDQNGFEALNETLSNQGDILIEITSLNMNKSDRS